MTDSSGSRTVTREELADLMRERFGEDIKQWAFICPACKDVATVQDFIDAGDVNAAGAGQMCIGRELGALKQAQSKWIGRGCDWAAFGLFGGPWTVVIDGREVSSFAPAPAPVSAGTAT